MEENVEKALEKVMALLEKNPNILEFKEVEAMLLQSDLKKIEEETKEKNKAAVLYDQVGLTNAKQKMEEESMQQHQALESTPLVHEYREKMLAANELLTTIVEKIEREVNDD